MSSEFEEQLRKIIQAQEAARADQIKQNREDTEKKQLKQLQEERERLERLIRLKQVASETLTDIGVPQILQAASQELFKGHGRIKKVDETCHYTSPASGGGYLGGGAYEPRREAQTYSISIFGFLLEGADDMVTYGAIFLGFTGTSNNISNFKVGFDGDFANDPKRDSYVGNQGRSLNGFLRTDLFDLRSVFVAYPTSPGYLPEVDVDYWGIPEIKDRIVLNSKSEEEIFAHHIQVLRNKDFRQQARMTAQQGILTIAKHGHINMYPRRT